MNTLALEILNGNLFQMHVSGVNRTKALIYVHVWGLFPTSGWINPALVLRVPRPGSEPPAADRFAEFDFYADPPPQGRVVVDVLTPVLCEAVAELPGIVHGVRIHGQKNFQEQFVRFHTTPLDNPASDGNDYVPIPWLVVRGGADVGG